MYGGRRGRYHSRNSGLVLLLIQIARIGWENIPPVTLGVTALNAGIHYLVNQQIPGWQLSDVCVGANMIWNKHELQRLVLASFFHVDDMHLYYNLSSFLWKGRFIEPLLGSFQFSIMIIIFTLISNLLMVVGSLLLQQLLDIPGPFYSCAVGFSAVLFALKVVATHFSTTEQSQLSFLPFSVPTKYLAWFELVLISILVPNASFFGHLCGILTGLMYTNGLLNPIFSFFQNLSQLYFNEHNIQHPNNVQRQNVRYSQQSDTSYTTPHRQRYIRDGHIEWS